MVMVMMMMIMMRKIEAEVERTVETAKIICKQQRENEQTIQNY